MMKKSTLKDKFNSPVADGYVTITAVDKAGNETVLLDKKNTVVNYARTIMRNAVIGECDKVINSVQIGDRNLTFDNNLNEDAPVVEKTMTSLIHPYLTVPLTSTEKAIREGRPTAIFNFSLPVDYDMGSQYDDGTAIIAECGLSDGEGLFSILFFKPIIKRSYSSLLIRWEILF